MMCSSGFWKGLHCMDALEIIRPEGLFLEFCRTLSNAQISTQPEFGEKRRAHSLTAVSSSPRICIPGSPKAQKF